MTPRLRLAPNQIRDLASVRDMEPADFDKAISALESLDPAPLHPDKLRTVLETALGPAQKDRIEVLIRQLLALYALVGQFGMTIDEVFEGLHFGIQSSGAWNNSQVEQWKQREPQFRKMFSLHSVRVVAKALNLAYEYQNLMRSSRILSDVRPIFNMDATEIEGAVITHVLSLRFNDVDGEHSLSLAVDENDIRSLKQQCERALQKAQTAKNYLTARAGLQVIISGQEEQ